MPRTEGAFYQKRTFQAAVVAMVLGIVMFTIEQVRSDDPRGGPSLRVETYHGASQDWVIPLSEEEILAQPPIPQEGPGADGADLTRDDVHCLHESRTRWVEDLGGVPGGEVVIGVSATANLDSVVLLKELEVDVLDQQPAPSGTTVALCIGAGPVDVYTAHVDLDSSDPRIRVFGPSGSLYDSTSFPRFEIEAGRAEEFVVHVYTQSSRVEFVIDLHFLVNGEDVVHRIDNEGAPFEVSGCTSAAVPMSDLGSDQAFLLSESCGTFPSS